MSRKKQLEAMNGLQIMNLIEKYEIDPNCKRTEAITMIIEHESKITRSDLEKMTGKELIELANEFGIHVNATGGKLKETKAAVIERIIPMIPTTGKKKRGARNAAKTKLKALRVASGLSQAALADASGLNLRTYQFYEQGARLIDNAGLEVILGVCKVLKCDIPDILESDDLIKQYEEYKNNRP